MAHFQLAVQFDNNPKAPAGMGLIKYIFHYRKKSQDFSANF